MAKGKAKRKVGAGDVASNRYASHRYQLLERLACGIAVQGTEGTALPASGAPAQEGYAATRAASNGGCAKGAGEGDHGRHALQSPYLRAGRRGGDQRWEKLCPAE